MFATGGLMHVKMHKSRCEAAEHFRVFFPGFCSVFGSGRLVPGLCVVVVLVMAVSSSPGRAA